MATWDVEAWLPIADSGIGATAREGNACWQCVWLPEQGRLFGPLVCDILATCVDIVVSEPQPFDE
jgi:hypothetical protein